MANIAVGGGLVEDKIKAMSAGHNSSFYIISTSPQDVHMWRLLKLLSRSSC